MEDNQELLLVQNLSERSPYNLSTYLNRHSFFQNWWGSSQQPPPTVPRSARSARAICEHCQEVCLAQHYEHHKRICRCNPANIRVSSSNSNSIDDPSSSNLTLTKTVCEYCNEPCYLRFHEDHKRICVKNPENIKVTCKFCAKTFCLASYNTHVDACAETMGYKEDLFLQRLEELAKREESGFGSSNPILAGDCPICIEGIKNCSESKRLPCGHHFHRRCIEMWARKQKKCPICRKGFI